MFQSNKEIRINHQFATRATVVPSTPALEDNLMRTCEAHLALACRIELKWGTDHWLTQQSWRQALRTEDELHMWQAYLDSR